MVHRPTYAVKDDHKVQTLSFLQMEELGYYLVNDGHGLSPRSWMRG